MRSALPASLLLALALTACQPPAESPSRNGLPDCGPPKHRTNAGACVDCVADTDCAQGQRCNDLTGTCEPRPAPADAGPPLGCPPSGRRCSADRQAVEVCVAVDGGSAWAPGQPCGVGGCDPARVACLICSDGDSHCRPDLGPGAYETCIQGGTATEVHSCGALTCAQLDADHAACHACEPNTQRCGTAPDGGVGVFTCDPTGTHEDYSWCYPTNACLSTDAGPVCASFICYPGQGRCVDADGGPAYDFAGTGHETCADDGRSWVRADCDPDSRCGTAAGQPGSCLTPCAVAEALGSDTGCDFWSARLGPGAPGSAGLALVLTNASDAEAHARLEAPGTPATSAVVPAHGSARLAVPAPALCGSGLARSAYHLTSDRPVRAVAFDPLEPAPGEAALLLPTARLGTSYGTLTAAGPGRSAQLAVVAVEDGTLVQLRLAGATAATPGRGACLHATRLATQPAGASAEYRLDRGQVLALWGAPGSDLTGTGVVSLPLDGGPARPVAVLSGAGCIGTCDRLLEQLQPVFGWPSEVAAAPRPPGEPADTFRIVTPCFDDQFCAGGVLALDGPVTLTATSAPDAGWCTATDAGLECAQPGGGPGQPFPWIEVQSAGGLWVRATSQVEVGRYRTSAAGGEALELVPGFTFGGGVLLPAPAEAQASELELVLRDALGESAVRLDGAPLAPGAWTPLPGGGAAAVVPLCGQADPGCTGLHTLETPGGAAATVSGQADAGPYSYPAQVVDTPVRIIPG